MQYLDILIPCAPNRHLPQKVLNSLITKELPCRLFFSNTVGNNDYAMARNSVKDLWQISPQKSRYCLMTNNDLIFPCGALQAMIDFLDQNSDFGAIGLEYNEAPLVPDTEATESTHINAGPTLWRNELFQKIEYHYNDGCECQGACNDLRKMGYRIGFLGSWHCDHIDDTIREDLKTPSMDDSNIEVSDQNFNTNELIEIICYQFGDLVNELKKIRLLL